MDARIWALLTNYVCFCHNPKKLGGIGKKGGHHVALLDYESCVY